MAKRMNPEERIHRAVVHFLHRALPPGQGTFYHVPNGGGRSKAEAGVLKALGTKAGTPDLMFVKAGGGAYGIELKPPGAYLRPVQKAVRAELEALGCPVAVCRSVEDVEAALRGWGFTLRATTGRAEGEAITKGEAAA